MSLLEEKLARSLTAETTELIPYLPYLLQDLWELGSSPGDILQLLHKHVPTVERTRILDLACGKGAVSIHLAKNTGCRVNGIDIMADFIAYAAAKAHEEGVAHLCSFTVGDANEVVRTEKGYDVVIFGAVGDVLGEPRETIEKLKSTIRAGGYLVIDDAYGKIGSAVDHYTKDEWLQIFALTGVRLIDEKTVADADLVDLNRMQLRLIQNRALELKGKYPENKRLFEDYIKSQQAECDLLEHDLTGVTLLIQDISRL